MLPGLESDVTQLTYQLAIIQHGTNYSEVKVTDLNYVVSMEFPFKMYDMTASFTIHVLAVAHHDRNIQYAALFRRQLESVYSFASWYISQAGS